VLAVQLNGGIDKRKGKSGMYMCRGNGHFFKALQFAIGDIIRVFRGFSGKPFLELGEIDQLLKEGEGSTHTLAEIIQSRGGEGSNPQVDPVMEQTPVLVLLGAQPYIAPVLPQLSPSVERASKGTGFEKVLVTYREQAIDGVGNTHLNRVVQRPAGCNKSPLSVLSSIKTPRTSARGRF